MRTIEVTLRTFIPAEAVAVNYPSNYVTNGNNRSFSTEENASVKTSQSVLLSFNDAGEPLENQQVDQAVAFNSTGPTELYNESDASESSLQSGIYNWRQDLRDGAVPVQTTKLDPNSFALPSVSAESAFKVDFILDAKNPLPPPLHVTLYPPVPPPPAIPQPPVEFDVTPPSYLVPAINAQMHLSLSQDASGTTLFTLYGGHDGFPAYEVLVDHRLVYTYNPLTSDADPFSGLASPLQVQTPFIVGFLTGGTELLTNGSFENEPGLTEPDYVRFTSLPGWTTEAGSAALEVSVSNYRGILGGDGNWLDTQGSPGGINISQNVDVVTGTTAHLTVTVAAGNRTSPLEHLQFLFNDTIVEDISLADFEGRINGYRQFAIDVTGQEGTDRLQIRSVGATSNFGFSLDKVSLTSGQNLVAGPLFGPLTTSIAPQSFGPSDTGLVPR